MLRTKFALIGYLCREWYPVSQGAGKNLVKLKPLARGYIDEVCMRIVDLVFFRVRSGTAGSAGLTLGIHVHLGSPSISVPFLLRWLAGVVLGWSWGELLRSQDLSRMKVQAGCFLVRE